MLIHPLTRPHPRARVVALLTVMLLLLLAVPASPADAAAQRLDGPDPALWLSDPEGVDGDAGIEQGDPVDGARGQAIVTRDRAFLTVRTTGLEPRHAYTMWIVYFSDRTACVDGCGPDDVRRDGVAGGVIYGDGAIVDRRGIARFTTRLRTGDGADVIGTPPPPFAGAPYAAGPNNEFHVVLRSHGPILPGELIDQLTTFGGGCDVEVGPLPGQQGDFPVPAGPGECGDVQVHIFS